MKLRGMAVVVFALGTHGLFGAVVSGPAVNSGTINYQTNQVTLIGAGFKPATTAPTVAFSNTALSLVSATNNQIVAKLPGSVAPGTFSITVTFWPKRVTNRRQSTGEVHSSRRRAMRSSV